MSDQSKLGLGQIITGEQTRDAIHIAVAPIIAAHKLSPGMNVGLDAEGKATNRTEKAIGVVDPFLKQTVFEDEKFWLFLYPGSITSLRHQWSHPAFDEATEPPVSSQDPKDQATKRIHEIAEVMDLTYNQLMRGAESWVYSEDYMTEQGSEHWRDTFPAYEEEFWKLYEVVTGETVPNDKKQSFFSCSC